MLAFQAFHLAAYHFAQGTFQPPAASSALGCSDLDGLMSDDPGPVDLNAAIDVCFDRQFSCSPGPAAFSHALPSSSSSPLRPLHRPHTRCGHARAEN